MRSSIITSILAILLFTSCRDSRIHEKPEWGRFFEAQGIRNASFMLRNHTHEEVFYYNKDRVTKGFLPASTFKIFNSLVALETGVAPDEQLIIKWDSVARRPEWDHDMNMREAFKVSNVGYYQEIARRIGAADMQHYLDTVNYGNKNMGNKLDNFWLNDSLKISADEQVGFLKRLYFNELPFSERTQRIVKSMMLREEGQGYKLYYKTGWGEKADTSVLWVVGFIEKIEKVKEDEKSMNKSGVRMYPYFFALNFDVPANDTSKNWADLRITILKDILKDAGAMPQ